MYPLQFNRRAGVQCAFCLWKSSRRSPTCLIHEELIDDVDVEEVNVIIDKYNSKEISLECANMALESIMAPGCRISVDYDGCSEFPRGVYDATVVEYNVNTKEYTVEYDYGYGTECINVFELNSHATGPNKETIEEYINCFIELYKTNDEMYINSMEKIIKI